MAKLVVKLDGDGAWPDLAGKVGTDQVIHVADESEIEIAVLEGGMESGLPSLAIRIDLPDGRVALIETSWRLFAWAAQGIAGRYGWP